MANLSMSASPQEIFHIEILDGKQVLIGVKDKRILFADIPDFVDELGREAFAGCESLESLILPTGIKVCTDDAFPNEKTPVLYYLGTRRDWEKATGYGRRKNIFRHKIRPSAFSQERPLELLQRQTREMVIKREF